MSGAHHERSDAGRLLALPFLTEVRHGSVDLSAGAAVPPDPGPPRARMIRTMPSCLAPVHDSGCGAE
eukprot:7377791-Prymnesium_polylepis.1